MAAALNYVGSIKVGMGDPEGVMLLDRALDITQRLQPHTAAWYACRICANLASKLLRFARIEEAEMYVERGLSIAREYDFQHGTSRLEAHAATIDLFRGNWDDAEATLRELIALPRDEGLNDAYVHSAIGRLLARRGDPEAEDHERMSGPVVPVAVFVLEAVRQGAIEHPAGSTAPPSPQASSRTRRRNLSAS